MNDPVDALVLDLLDWIGRQSRPYAEALEVWRTSCPRLPVWEEAHSRGYLEHTHSPGQEPHVALSSAGLARLTAALAARQATGAHRAAGAKQL
jgi:D-3-phosphoglycerate dehydrogenase / 2-oxoglutarate reductase